MNDPTPVVEEQPTIAPPVIEQPIDTQPLKDEPTPVEPKRVEVKPSGRRSTETPPVEDDYIDVGKNIRFNKMPFTTQAEPAKVEPAKVEPVKVEPIKVEPVKVEPIKTQPVEPEPIQTEPIKPVPVDAEIVDPEQLKNETTSPFTDLTPTEPVTFEPRVDQPEPAVDNPYQPYREPTSTTNNRSTNVKPIEQPQQSTSTTVKKKGKKLKPRFVKLTSDDSFDYYLDKSSVQWQNMPYSTSEYMADVWIRMLDKETSLDGLPPDMQSYISDQSNDEIAQAEAKGLIYDPVDVKVLRTKKYFLEHYYIRPQKRQIQFLCELEVVGRPQNTISERAYDYKNWENLIPGSVETAIYYGVLDVIGTSKASSRGHMTAADMVEEYARISIR